jgi:hypothetical protein
VLENLRRSGLEGLEAMEEGEQEQNGHWAAKGHQRPREAEKKPHGSGA